MRQEAWDRLEAEVEPDQLVLLVRQVERVFLERQETAWARQAALVLPVRRVPRVRAPLEVGERPVALVAQELAGHLAASVETEVPEPVE